MAAAIFRFRRVRDELRSLLGDTSVDNQQWRDDELDTIIGECMDYGSTSLDFSRRMAGYYQCPALGGDDMQASWFVMAEEDKGTPAPFTGQTDCIYLISCRGTIRVSGTGTESSTVLSVTGCMVNWGRVYDKMLEVLEGRKVQEAQVSSGDGTYSPPDENRIRNFREYRKGAR